MGGQKQFVQIYGPQQNLAAFIRTLVGLDRAKAKERFAQFLDGQTYTADQIRFVNYIINHLAANGTIAPELLYAELKHAQRRGTALIREVAAEARSGVRSAPEAEVRAAVLQSGLPTPLWNPGLFLPNGAFLAQPDGLIEASMVAIEVDSREHHSQDYGWEHTLERDTDLSNEGLIVVHVIPRRFRRNPSETLNRLHRAHERGLTRPRPELRVVPCAEFEQIRASWGRGKFGERA